MKKLAALLLALLFALSVVAQESAPPKTGKVTQDYDRFKDLTTVSLEMQLTGEAPRGLAVKAVQSFGGKAPAKAPDKILLAFVSAGDKQEYAIEHGLIFLADGERLKVDNSAYMKDRAGSGYIEMMVIAVPLETLKKVANAHKVEAQLGETEFELDDKQRASLKQFLSFVVPQ
jgi:hypothetical protein